MRRVLVILLLVLITLWPLVHRVMVAQWQTNPWKFFGWAMFCVPDVYHTGLLGDVKSKDTPNDPAFIDRALAQKTSLFTDEDEFALRAYLFQRKSYGAFADQGRLAREVLQRHPRIKALAVLVKRMAVDRHDGRMKWTVEVTVHAREGPPHVYPLRNFAPP